MHINNIKQMLNEAFRLNIPINEMAYLGGFDQYQIVIETNDHNPPHFHVKVNKGTVCRIEIPENFIEKTYELRYMKNSKIRLSSRNEKLLMDWFKASSKPNPRDTNLNMLQVAWNMLHPDNPFVW